MNGQRCPYVASFPATDAAAAVWSHILACQSQLRTGMAGIVGFDFPAILQMGAGTGIDRGILALMLPYADAGLRLGLAKLKHSGDGTE